MSELTDVMQRFRRDCADSIAKKAEHLAKGGASTFEEYRTKTGEIAGLKEALGIFNSAVKSRGEQDDE
jgi:hypothetical protein